MFNIYKLFQPQEFLPDIEPLLNQRKTEIIETKTIKSPKLKAQKYRIKVAAQCVQLSLKSHSECTEKIARPVG